jgi:hypothetical protein
MVMFLDCSGYGNCGMQDGLLFVTVKGVFHGTGSCGGENRSGGLFANGMPFHDLTPDGANTPTTSPSAIFTDAGPCASTLAIKPIIVNNDCEYIVSVAKE